MTIASSSLPVLKFKRRLELIDVKDIVPNKENPRENISKSEVNDLSVSIKTMGGVLVPIVVFEQDGKYVLLDGERRWRACIELSRKDKKFALVPANIIAAPLNSAENLQTMFNIHQKRKEWSTAAIAEAIGRLKALKGNLTVTQIEDLTGVDNASINQALGLLTFPDTVRQRCLDGELDESYPIIIAEEIKAVHKGFPALFKEYSKDYASQALLRKVDKGYVQRARDFKLIGRAARKSITYEVETVFENGFQKLIKDDHFTPRKLENEVQKTIAFKGEEPFRLKTIEYLDALETYLKSRNPVEGIPEYTRKQLYDIYVKIKDLVVQSKLA